MSFIFADIRNVPTAVFCVSNWNIALGVGSRYMHYTLGMYICVYVLCITLRIRSMYNMMYEEETVERLSLWRDQRNLNYIPRCYFLCVPGFPQRITYANVRCKVVDPSCALIRIRFLSYLVFSKAIFQYPLLILTPTHLPSTSEYGVSG